MVDEEAVEGVSKIDDGIFCKPCRARNGVRCESEIGVWARVEIPRELRARPLRCAGYLPSADEKDQRPGSARWCFSAPDVQAKATDGVRRRAGK